MRSRTDVADNGRERSLDVEVPRGTSSMPRPDPEVPERAKRRRFPALYKLRILEKAEACRAPGEVGALLRREGLYSSHLTQWRRARREGSLKAFSKQRGPKRRRDQVAVELKQLRKENPCCGVGWNRLRRSSRFKKSLRDPGIPLRIMSQVSQNTTVVANRDTSSAWSSLAIPAASRFVFGITTAKIGIGSASMWKAGPYFPEELTNDWVCETPNVPGGETNEI